MNPCNRWLTFAGRVLLSLIFIISGLGKVAAPDATIGYISSVGAPFPEVAYAIALLVELGLGLALLLGFKAKFAAAGIAIFTLAAAFMFHTDFSNQIQLVMFMKNFTIIGGLLLIVAHGAGGFGLDNRK